MAFSKDAEEFLAKPNYMVLSTLKKDGNIQMSIVWFEYRDGKFWVSTTKGRAKYFNIKRNPHVTFIIPEVGDFYTFFKASGTASFSEEKTHEFIDDLSMRYTGKSPYAGDPEHKEDRINIIITPDKYEWRG